MPGEHAVLSPSSAKRWINCPGSVALVATCPEKPTSKFAAAGTVAHSLNDDYLSGKITLAELIDKIGDVVVQEGHDIEITEEMVEKTEEYKDVILSIIEEIKAEGRPSPVTHQQETRVFAKSIDDGVWGRLDMTVYQKGNVLYVIDYKYGMGVVEVEENEQLAIYAVGAMETIAGHAYDKVVFVIHQPRAFHPDGPLRKWTVPTGWLEEFKVRAKKAAELTRSKDAPLCAGDWCRSSFCPAQSLPCPAIQAKTQDLARLDFAEDTPENKMLPVVSEMPLDKLAAVLDWKELIKSWLNECEARAKEILMSGEKVTGYKIVEGRSTRKIVNPEAIASALELLHADEEIFDKKLKGLTALTKLAKKTKIAEFEAEGWIVKPPGAFTVAKSTDKREAVVRATAKDDFIDVSPEKKSGGGLFDGLVPDPLWPKN